MQSHINEKHLKINTKKKHKGEKEEKLFKS